MTVASGDLAFRQLGEAWSEVEIGTTRITQPPRPSRRRRRGREGCLKDMHTLPLDLLYEVWGAFQGNVNH